MSNNFLLYGDLITLNSFFYDKQGNRLDGSLSGKGFFDHRVFFQIYSQNLSKITNARDFVFQVWPVLSCEAYKQLAKGLKEKDFLTNLLKNQPNDHKIQENLNALEGDLSKIRSKIEIENEFNKRSFELNYGFNVSYGSEIQLLHYDSQMFLSGRIITSEVEKSSFKFELTDNLNSGMVFVFEPRYKLRQLGENIQYNDQILIKNEKLSCFINFSIETPLVIDRDLSKDKSAKPFKDYYKNLPTNRIDQESRRFEAFLSNFSDFQFQMKLYSRRPRLETEIKPLRGGDMVRLRHTETGSDLTGTINFKLDVPELYMRSYSGEYELEKETIESIFVLEREEEIELGGECLFIDENQGLENQPKFRLRHMLTGRLMSIHQSGIPVLNYNEEKAKNKEEQVFHLKFRPTLSRDHPILRNYGVYHLEFKGGLYLHIDSEKIYVRHECVKIDPNEENFEPLNDNELFIERKMLVLKKESSEENAFQIIKVSEEERKLFLNLASVLPVLTYSRDSFRYQIRDEEFEDICKKGLKILQDMIFFVIKTESDNPYECEGIPLPERQKIIRDMKIIEILVDLLYFPFKTGSYDIKLLQDKVPDDIIKLFILCYRLIKFTIEEYRPNEVYASQWITLFMNQSLLGDPLVDIQAEPTLTELIDNNKTVLETKIKKETIKKFVDLILVDQNKKYVNLLRALSVCDGEPMLINQAEISKTIFGNKTAKDLMVFQIREENDKNIEIFVYEKWINPLSFNEESKLINDKSNKYEFFLATIELFADLCLRKNYIAIDELKDIYTLHLCSLIISNEKYPIEIRISFIKLINTLWVEQEAQPIDHQSLIRSWEEIVPGNPVKMICSDLDVSKFDGLKEFIINHMIKLKKEGYQKAYEIEYNKLTLHILKMLKTMIDLGFMKTSEDLSYILSNIVFLLNAANDVTNLEEYQVLISRDNKIVMHSKKKSTMVKSSKLDIKRFISRYSLTEETLIIMNCKEVICDILKSIILLRNDMRLTQFMQEFRREYELNKVSNDEEPQSVASVNSAKRMLNQLTESLSINSKEDHVKKIENPINWIINIINRQGGIDINGGFPIDLALLLLDLTLYKSDSLINKAFEILNLIYAQADSIYSAAKNLQLLEDESMVQSYFKIKELKERIAKNIDNAENWYGLKENETFKITLNDINLLTKMIIDEDQSVKIKNNNDPDLEPFPQVTNEIEEIFKNNNESELIFNYHVNKEKQELMKNLNVHLSIISMIKFDVNSDLDKADENSYLPVLKACYKFLSYFCYNNSKNQGLLENELSLFKKHLKKKPKSNVYLFIIELFRNNKIYLFNPKKIDNIIKAFCEMIETSNNPTLNVFLLYSLKTLLKSKQTVIKVNQTRLIAEITSKKYQKVLILLASENELQKINNLIQVFMKDIDDTQIPTNKIFNIPVEIDYICNEMMILALASEEKNDAAESRCQLYFPLNTLLDLLINSKRFWYFRRYVLFFLFHVYLDTEKEMHGSIGIINKLISIILEDFEAISQELDQQKEIEIRNFKGLTTFYNIKLDYLFSALVPCLEIIFKVNLISSDKVLELYKRTMEAIINLSEKIQQKSYRKFLANFLSVITKKKSYMQKIDFEKNYKHLIPSDFRIDQTYVKYVRATTKLAENSTSPHKKTALTTNTDLLQSRLNQLQRSDLFTSMIEAEFESFVVNIVEIEDLTSKVYKGLSTIGYQELCISMLKLIDPINMILTTELTISGIKVFRKIIERENKSIKTPAAEWQTSDYDDYSKKIKERQDQLCEFGVVEVIGNMIASNLSLELKKEAILLGIAMLLGGNEKTQEAFYQYFVRQDSKNKMLSNLKLMIEESFMKIKKKMEIKNRRLEETIIENDKMLEKSNTINLEQQKSPKKSKITKVVPLTEEEVHLIENKNEENNNNESQSSVKQKRLEKAFNSSDSEEEDDIIENIKGCTEIYRFLQLFCEGHNLKMQEHLREQTYKKQKSGRTVNFISFSSYKFGSIIKFVNVQSVDLMSQIIDFLIEALQGPCVLNQLELSNAKVIDFVKDLLSSFIRDFDYQKRGFFNKDDKQKINSIVTKSSNLLISLIEGNQDDTILKDLSLKLDFNFMRSILTKEFENFLTSNLNLTAPFPSIQAIQSKITFPLYEGNIAQAFNMYILIKTIADNIIAKEDEEMNPASFILQPELEGESETSILAMEFYDMNVVSIELLFKDKLHRIFFPVQPACLNLSRNTRIELMNNVKRDSVNDKIMGLIGSSANLFDEMLHMTKLKPMEMVFSPKRFNFLKDLSTLAAFFLNILMLATFYRKIDNKNGNLEKVESKIIEGGIENTGDGDTVNILLWVFGITQVCTSVLTIIFWFIMYSKLIVQRKWRELNRENRQKMLDKQIEEEIEEMDTFNVNEIDNKLANYLLYVKGPDSKYFLKNGKSNFGSTFIRVQYYLKSLIMLLSENMVLYMIFYLVVSFLGLFMTPIFYSYQLLDIVNRFETLKNVIRSVTRNANQLILTLLLGLLILYLYTILMFFFLYDAYWNEEINGTGENMCVTMFQCYLTTVNYGLRLGGGFGDKITVESFNSENRGRYYVSVVLEITAFCSINIIFLNIIFGIIIDTFAELRDEKTKIDEDMTNICFICGLTRYDFEKTGQGFDKHIDNDHRLWHYLYYIFHLKNKDETEYTGIESDIISKIENDDISWFPLMKAIVLGEGKKEVNVSEIIEEKTLLLKHKIDETIILADRKLKSIQN